ncbi:MAG: hypothetical protein ACO25L_02310 [Candidatus Nanopelagicales bacterium]|nr:hypothetical protein [Synechococcus phage DSL-LC03]
MVFTDEQEVNLKKSVKGSIQHAIDRIFDLYDSGKIKDAEALSKEFDVWFQEDYGDYYIMCLTSSE